MRGKKWLGNHYLQLLHMHVVWGKKICLRGFVQKCECWRWCRFFFNYRAEKAEVPSTQGSHSNSVVHMYDQRVSKHTQIELSCIQLDPTNKIFWEYVLWRRGVWKKKKNLNAPTPLEQPSCCCCFVCLFVCFFSFFAFLWSRMCTMFTSIQVPPLIPCQASEECYKQCRMYEG